MLEGYFFVHNFSNTKTIFFPLLKVVPHVKDWWETYCKKNTINGFEIFGAELTWEYFMEALKEKYYVINNYDDRYTIWTTLHE